jgi:hypothetical protein
MAIEIVDFPIKNDDFPVRKLLLYQGVSRWIIDRCQDQISRSLPDKDSRGRPLHLPSGNLT